MCFSLVAVAVVVARVLCSLLSSIVIHVNQNNNKKSCIAVVEWTRQRGVYDNTHT